MLRTPARIVLAVTLAMAHGVPAAAAEWTIKVIPPRDGYPLVAMAMNDDGNVAGYTGTADYFTIPVLWTPNRGYVVVTTDWGRAIDVNNHDEVVGWYYPNRDFSQFHGFVWSAERGLRDLGSFYPQRIGDSGLMVGTCAGPDTLAHICRWTDAGPQPLDTVPGGSQELQVFGIDPAGDIVGTASATVAGWASRAFIVDHREGAIIPALDQGQCSFAAGINLGGAVAGTVSTCMQRASNRIVVWAADGTIRRSVVAPFSAAIGIDGAGAVVANETPLSVYSDDEQRPQDLRAWVWDGADTTRSYLPRLTATGAIALDVNSDGDVLGVMRDAKSEDTAVIWRRVHERANPRVTTPNTSSSWAIGSLQRLAWTYTGSPMMFQIDVSRDDGRSWEFVDVVVSRSGGSQNYYWTVTGPDTVTARMRVSVVGDAARADVNNAPIRISAPSLAVTIRSTPHLLRWSTQRIVINHNLGAGVPVTVEVTTDDGRTWHTIGRTRTAGSAMSTFDWFVDQPDTPSATVRVRALDGSGAADTSAPFSIDRGAAGRLVAHELPLLPGTIRTVPNAINDAGVVVGSAETHWPSYGDSNVFRAFRWSPADGYSTILEDAVALDINNTGTIVGTQGHCFGWECLLTGFKWTAGEGVVSLGLFLPYSLNDRGDIVGLCVTNNQDDEEPIFGRVCVWWHDAATSAVPLRGGDVYTTSRPRISNAGDIVWYDDLGGAIRRPDGSVRGIDGEPMAVNDAGLILGTVGGRATIWNRDGVQQTQAAFGPGSAVLSNQGIVIGCTDLPDDAGVQSIAYSWNVTSGTVERRGASGANCPADVNNAGQVAAARLRAARYVPLIWWITQ
jgi:hypothetical protein